MQTRVIVQNEVRIKFDNGWSLNFQEVIYAYGDGYVENGFRFIWRRPNGSLQAARGQARIPDRTALETLTNMAEEQGWY